MKKRLAVLWSGGCDSTVILHYLLNNKDVVENYEIRTFSFDINKIDNFESRDKQARTQLILEFEKRNLPKFKHTEHILSNEQPVAIIRDKSLPGQLPAIWACISPIYLYPSEDLYIGYLKDEDAAREQTLIETFYAGQKAFGHTGLLKYPLKSYFKEEIMKYLVEYNLNSLVNTCCWTNDFNNEKNYYELYPTPCWKCPSCRKILKANMILENFPEDLKSIKVVME